jgi:hypothetical protein
MKTSRVVWIALLALISVPPLSSQEKPTSPSSEAQSDSAPPQTLLKLKFLVTEYDGTKKVASLPYEVSGMTSHVGKRDSFGVLRVGARIPVATQKASDQSITEFVYVDVGTSIDYWVWPQPDHSYLVSGTIELSSLFGNDSSAVGQTTRPEGQRLSSNENPVLHQTKADFTIGLRDGQPGEALSVTDPITGRVLKLEVTVDTVK